MAGLEGDPGGEAVVRCLACAGGHVHPGWADRTDAASCGEGRQDNLMDATVAIKMGTPRLGEMWKAVQALWLLLLSVGGWKSGNREPGEQPSVGGGLGPGSPECQPISTSTPFPASLPAVINKYKRRRFQKTKNLLTGETEADPEMIKVNTSRAIRSWGRRPDPGFQLSRQPRGVVSCTTPEPLGEPSCLSLSSPRWKQSQDAVSSQGAGLQARFQPTSGSGGAGPLRTVHRPTQKPLASPLGGSRHRQTCLRCQSQEMAGLRFTPKLPGPEPRVGLAQRRQWLILWLWKEHSPSAQDVNRPQESPSPQGGSRQGGGP